MVDSDVEQTCVDCNAGFPADQGATEWAICLNDPELEPYLDLLLEQQDYSQCRAIISRKRFPWNRPACEKFEPIDCTPEIQLSTRGAEELSRFADRGELTTTTLQEVMLREQLRATDWSTEPVDSYVDSLQQARSYSDKHDVLRVLGWLITQQNEAALNALCDYLDQLPPPTRIEETHLRTVLAEQLGRARALAFRHRAAGRLVTDLRRIPSNNTTRGYYTAVFDFFERSPGSLVEEHLCPLLESRTLSYRRKRRIRAIRDSSLDHLANEWNR